MIIYIDIYCKLQNLQWCFHRSAPEGHVMRTEPKQGAKDRVAQFGKIIHLVTNEETAGETPSNILEHKKRT